MNPTSSFYGQWRRWLVWLALLPAIVLAAVTAQQVAEAVRNSPTASAWLKQNAEAVGNLALKLENTAGNLAAYNGSCCYGILQMNKTNIADQGYTVDQYRALPLQQQVDAWTKVMSSALNASAPKQLAGLGSFDGRTVDGNMVLACVQLGIGNCQKMLNSGSCSGFADINGTTICKMADKMSGTSGSGSGTGTTGTPPSTGTGQTPSGGNNCIRSSDGSCLPLTHALEESFEAGSGVAPSRLRSINQALLVAVTILVMGGAMLGLWRNYASGAIDQAVFMLHAKQAALIVCTILLVMTLA
jgi:hypothetical protein